jgi:hypothetical protein
MAILAMSPMGILPMVGCFFCFYSLQNKEGSKGEDTPVRA